MSGNNYDNVAGRPTSQDRTTGATQPLPPEEVDALLAESLKAQSERDFTWKEPERKPRWWERADQTGAVEPPTSHQTVSAAPSKPPARDQQRQSVRVGSVIFGLVALVLAAWVVASVVFGVALDPLLIGLVVCTLAGLSLVAAGLRPKPGARI